MHLSQKCTFSLNSHAIFPCILSSFCLLLCLLQLKFCFYSTHFVELFLTFFSFYFNSISTRFLLSYLFIFKKSSCKIGDKKAPPCIARKKMQAFTVVKKKPSSWKKHRWPCWTCATLALLIFSVLLCFERNAWWFSGDWSFIMQLDNPIIYFVKLYCRICLH